MPQIFILPFKKKISNSCSNQIMVVFKIPTGERIVDELVLAVPYVSIITGGHRRIFCLLTYEMGTL